MLLNGCLLHLSFQVIRRSICQPIHNPPQKIPFGWINHMDNWEDYAFYAWLQDNSQASVTNSHFKQMRTKIKLGKCMNRQSSLGRPTSSKSS